MPPKKTLKAKPESEKKNHRRRRNYGKKDISRQIVEREEESDESGRERRSTKNVLSIYSQWFSLFSLWNFCSSLFALSVESIQYSRSGSETFARRETTSQEQKAFFQMLNSNLENSWKIQLVCENEFRHEKSIWRKISRKFTQKCTALCCLLLCLSISI